MSSIMSIDNYTLPTDQLFNLEFQFESVLNLEFQAKFGIQIGIAIPMGINLGECSLITNMKEQPMRIVHTPTATFTRG